MTIGPDQLAQRLATALSADAVRAEPAVLASHVVDGVTPALVCMPRSAEQVAAALTICAEAEASVIPRGGGTAMTIGNPPRRADVVITLSALNRLIEHDHANLTATMQSGVVLSSLQNALAAERQ